MERLHYLIQPTLHEEKPETLLINTGIIPSKQHNWNNKDVVKRIMDIGLDYRECGVKDMTILSTLVKRNFNLTRIIRQIGDLLRKYCISTNFHYLTNDNISR